MNSSTSAAQVMVKYDGVDGGRSGVVDKLSKSRKVGKKSRNRQKSEKPQRPGKFAKTIGLEKRLPKHRSSVNKELELLLEL